MADEVRVVVRDPQAVGPTDGLELLPSMQVGGDPAIIADDRHIVGMWVLFENPPGNQVVVEHSGHEIFSVTDKNGSKCIAGQRDVSGAGAGGQHRTYTALSTPGPSRTVEKTIADTVIAGRATWATYNGGDGSDYDAALTAARVLVGLPS
jgi:hypothetical protein